MENRKFIEEIGAYIRKYAPLYGIKVHSPIIAQAVLESASGTSDKVLKDMHGVTEWRHNYFGLKWRNNRCQISNDYFEEWTAEQLPDGTYKNVVDRFCKFRSMEECVIGYFQWTNIPNYYNLKGVKDPRTYLENIKADRYATSHDYVENVMAVIERYNLTRFDTEEVETMRINVHAGHNPDGKPACGAVGLIRESTEARAVKDRVIAKLRSMGHTVHDCTVDNGTSQADVLRKIVAKCNAHPVDLDVSIHFNAGAADPKGNGKTAGTEVFLYNAASAAKPFAQKVVAEIGKLGFRIRDDAVKDNVKTASYLYVLKNTKSPAMLLECCFVDDADDVRMYNAETMANSIVNGIAGRLPESPGNVTNTKPHGKLYRVQCGAFSKKENAEKLQQKLKAAGFDAIIV